MAIYQRVGRRSRAADREAPPDRARVPAHNATRAQQAEQAREARTAEVRTGTGSDLEQQHDEQDYDDRSLLCDLAHRIIDRLMPVGFGARIEGGGGVTIGVGAIDLDGSTMLLRKSDNTLTLVERRMIAGGADVGVGVGRTLGKDAKSSRKQMFAGADASANVMAMAKHVQRAEYELPLFDDDAFFALLSAFAGVDTAVSAASLVFERLESMDLSSYLKKLKLDFKVEDTATASANAGLRMGETTNAEKAKQKTNETQRWNADDGMAKELGSTNMWTKMLGLEVGAAAQCMTAVGASLEMERKGDTREVSLSGEIEQLLSAGLNLPFIPGLSKLAHLNPHGAAGVKLSCQLKDGNGEEPTRIGDWKIALVTKTGEMDSYVGNASETEMALQLSGASFDSVHAFIDSLGEVTLKRRVGVTSPLGGKALSKIEDQKNLTSQLKANYKEGGGVVKGFLDFDFKLSSAQVQRIALAIHHLIEGALAATDPLPKLQQTIATFAATGTLPPELQSVVDLLSTELRASLDKVDLHGELGVKLAAGTHIAAGVKARAHGRGGAIAVYHYDVTKSVRDLSLADIRQLIEGKYNDAKASLAG